MTWDIIIALAAIASVALGAWGFAWKVRANDIAHIHEEIAAVRKDIADLRDQFIRHLTDHGA